MSTNNKPHPISLIDSMLDRMKKDERSNSDGHFHNDSCPLGLTEEFADLPMVVSAFRTEQREGVDEIKKSIQTLTDAILDTDKGVASRMKSLEGTKSSLLKWFWIVLASSTTILLGKYITSLF